MSKPDKHIENIYRERLINAEVNPPPKAWEQIANSLDSANKNRRLLFYRRLVASAAVIIILLSVGIGILYQKRQITPSENLTNVVVDSTIQTTDTNFVIPSQPIQENIAEKELPKSNTTKSLIQPLIKEILANETIIPAGEKRVKSNLMAMQQIASNIVIFNFEWPALLLPKKELKYQPFLYDAELNKLVFNEDLIADAATPETRKNRWSLGGEISPSRASVSSQTDKAFYDASSEFLNSYQPRNTSEEVISAYTGGLAVTYLISKNLSIQSGIYYFKQGQKIQNFDVLSNETAFDNSITTSSNSGIIQFTATDVIESNNPIRQIALDANYSIAQFDDALVQQFGFIEIPFILKYKILSKKLNIYLLGGFNANILVNNKVFIGQNSKNSVGHTDGINSLIYKSTLGISLEYPIFKNFYFNLSPVIKYQLNSISKESANNYKTRFIEYKTGLSYHF